MQLNEEENFKLIASPGSTKLAIFFSGTNKDKGKFDFWRVAQLQSTNVLLLNNGANDWYQNGIPNFGSTLEDSLARIQQIARSLNVKEIYTIGVSMGAYGAILFGVHLDAKILAFGPDTLLQIQGSRSLRWNSEEKKMRFPDLVPLIEASPCPISLYAGEMDTLDMYGASRIAHLPTVTAVSVRGMDHGGGRYIDKALGLPVFVASFIADRRSPVINEAGTVLEEPGLADLLYSSHCAGLDGDWKKAEDVAKQAVKLSPKCEAAHYLLGTSLLKRKKIGEAEEHFAMVAAYLPHFTPGKFYLAHCLRAGGRLRAALHMFLAQAVENPEYAPTQYNLGIIYDALGEPKTGIAAMQKAVKLKPKNEKYKLKLKELEA